MTRRPNAILSGLGVSLLLALVASPHADADLPVPGQHRQRTTATLDFGEYAAGAPQFHTVVAGDTLQKIAKAKLGALSRWKQIAALNPDVKPEALAVGTRLSVPPTDGAGSADAPMERWHFFSLPQPSMRLRPFGHGERVPVDHYSTEVFAVREDGLAAFQKQFAEAQHGRGGMLDALRKQPPAWFAYAEGLHPGRGSTDDNDPVWRIEKEMRVTSIADGRIHLKLLGTRYFAQGGKQLTEAEIASAKLTSYFWIFLVALAGTLGLFVVIRRRRARAAAAA